MFEVWAEFEQSQPPSHQLISAPASMSSAPFIRASTEVLSVQHVHTSVLRRESLSQMLPEDIWCLYLADDLLHILSYSQSCLCTSYWSRPQLLRVFRPLRTPFLRHCFSFYIISDLITVCSCWCLALLLLFLSPTSSFRCVHMEERGCPRDEPHQQI